MLNGSKRLNVRPWVRECSEAVFKKIGFEVHSLVFSELKNGLLRVDLEWRCEREEWKTKFSLYYGKSLGYWDCAYLMHFPEIKYRFPSHRDDGKQKRFTTTACLEIGLECLVNRVARPIRYEPLFHQNLGYGASVFFGPKRKWNATKELIETYRKEENE